MVTKNSQANIPIQLCQITSTTTSCTITAATKQNKTGPWMTVGTEKKHRLQVSMASVQLGSFN